MKTFEEFTDLVENFKTEFINAYQISEMPQDINIEVDERFIDLKLIKPIRKAILENNIIILDKNKGYIELPLSFSSSIYVKVDTKGIILGATKMEGLTICNKTYMVPEITKKYSSNNISLELYKLCSFNKKLPILSDDMQTVDSMNVWKKWYLNPTKYGIKDVLILNTNTCSINDLGIDNNIRLIVDFNKG